LIARSRKHRLSFLAALCIFALALVPAAFAGKGGGGKGGTTSGSNTLSVVMLSDANGNGLPNWGDQLTFKVSTSASYPSVELGCAQNGSWVYAQVVGFYPTYFGSQTFTLKAPNWTGGAADCTVWLYTTGRNGTRVTLASSSIHVGA
jgi:hypothetical protein